MKIHQTHEKATSTTTEKIRRTEMFERAWEREGEKSEVEMAPMR